MEQPQMEQPQMEQLEKSLELPVGLEELWASVSNGDAWASWLADETAIDVAPGAIGTVTDDGEERIVVVEEVSPTERVVFRWWPVGDDSATSRVVLAVSPCVQGSRLVITETPLPLDASALQVRACSAGVSGTLGAPCSLGELVLLRLWLRFHAAALVSV